MHASFSLRLWTAGKKEGGERGEEKGEEEEEEGGQSKERRMMKVRMVKVVGKRTGERFFEEPRGDQST